MSAPRRRPPPRPGSALERFADLAHAHPRRVLAVAAILVVAFAALAAGAPTRLKSGGFFDDRSESVRARTLVETRFGRAQPNLTLLVAARSGTVDDPRAARAAVALVAQLERSPHVDGVVSHWGSASASLRSRDRRSALVLARVPGDDTEQLRRLKELRTELAWDRRFIDVRYGGPLQVNLDFETQAQHDLLVAEAVAVPLTFVLLVLVFGSLVAAMVPLAVGLFVGVGTVALLRVLAELTDVSIFALNVTSALALGLAIDYSLLLVSRYRSELAAGREPHDALAASLRTAGRTVVFSAAAVAAALGSLLLFPQFILRSFAYAGVAVVVLAALAALTIVPALLVALGPRLDRGRILRSVPGATPRGAWYRIGRTVVRRPLIAALPVLALLAVLAAPALDLKVGAPDERALPADAESRQVAETLRHEFEPVQTAALAVVASPAGAVSPDAARYADRLSMLPGVARVESPAGVFAAGERVASQASGARELRAGRQALLYVLPTSEPLTSASERLVARVRAEPVQGGSALVGGPTAEIVDVKASIGARLPAVLAVIALSTYCLLFALTRSVILPLKALVLNVVALSATIGVVVWVFQQGHLADLVGVTPQPLAATVPVLLFCILFGLSMDYEVFLVASIREQYEATGDVLGSIVDGQGRVGWIIACAAAILCVTFLAVGTSQLAYVKLFGLGAALALILDATVVRGILVPAFMTIAGRWNWWAPPVLRAHGAVGPRSGTEK